MSAAKGLCLLMLLAPMTIGWSAHAGGGFLVFRWEPIDGADRYELVICEAPGCRQPALREVVRETSFRWPTLAQRKYHWKVRALGAQGEKGEWSALRAIQPVIVPRQPLAPVDGARVLVRKADQPVKFSWEPSKAVETYVLELAEEASFKQNVRTFETTSTEVEAPVSHGKTFYWRVRGTDVNGRGVPPGPRYRLEVGIEPPEPALPAASGVVERGAAATPLVTFRWASRPVQRYQLELRASGGEPQTHEILDAPEVSLPLASLGTYTWRVRGVEPETDWSPTVSFEVRALPEPTVAQAPALATAEAQERARTAGRVELAPRFGVFHGAGDFFVARGGLELGFTPAAFGQRLRLCLWTEAARHERRVSEEATGWTARSVLLTAPVGLFGHLRLPLPWATLYAGLGPMLTLERATQQVEALPPRDESWWSAGAGGVLGAERRLGPGSAFVELSGTLGTTHEGIAVHSASGAGIALGYRFRLTGGEE